MIQELLREIFIFTYALSSCAGMVLFFCIWRGTRADRLELRKHSFKDRREARQVRSIAFRNEIASAILAIAFAFYAIVGAISATRLLGAIYLPWVEGVVTIPLLVGGNVIEMILAIVILSARKSINRP